MEINIDNLVSITEANQNFSKVARLVDKNGSAVILKNNSPKYVIMEYAQFKLSQTKANENIETIAQRVINNNIEAFKELAK